MEDIKWTRIFSAAQPWKAEIYKGLLEENGIRCVLVNKQDSSYLFGEVELYVEPEEVINALRIIDPDKA